MQADVQPAAAVNLQFAAHQFTCGVSYDCITALEILRVTLSDWDIRDLVLDQMDLSDAEAGRILQKVCRGLEVLHEPQG